MTFDAIMKDIQAGNFQPVYFLCGEEPFYIDKISDYIEEHALTEAEKAFNQIVLYGKEVDHKAIEDNARQFPMMASRRVVILKEAQNMRTLDMLAGYIENPSPQTILVINHKYKKPDKRKAFGKVVSKKTCYLETKKLYDNQVGGWIQNYLRSSGVKIDPDVSELVAEYLGTDLSKITNELDKILINLGDKKNIDAQVVQDNIGISKDYNVFEFQKALGMKDELKVYRIIQYFSENPKSNPIPLLVGSLYNYFSKLLITRANLQKGDQNLMSALKLGSPYFLREYKQAAGKFSIGQLKNIIKALSKADQYSKGIGSRMSTNKSILIDFANVVLHH